MRGGCPEEAVAPVRCGVLGCSDIARRKFIPALRGSRRAELVAVGSRDPLQAAGFVPGAAYAALGYEELVSHPGLELVYISVPNHLHEEWTLRALDHGKHVICEKPLALSAAAVERMVAAAEDRGLLLYENLMFLHHPQHDIVAELLASGMVGRPALVRSVFSIPLPAAGGYRLDPACGGGAFHDLARYPLGTALRFLAGEVTIFQGVALEQAGLNLGVHGVACTTAGEVFSYSIAFGQQYESYYEIIGERGKIRLDRAYTTPADFANRVLVRCGVEDAAVSVPPCDQFGLMLDHVCGLIRRGADFRGVHNRTRQLARLADAMEKGCRHDS